MRKISIEIFYSLKNSHRFSTHFQFFQSSTCFLSLWIYRLFTLLLKSTRRTTERSWKCRNREFCVCVCARLQFPIYIDRLATICMLTNDSIGQHWWASAFVFMQMLAGRSKVLKMANSHFNAKACVMSLSEEHSAKKCGLRKDTNIVVNLWILIIFDENLIFSFLNLLYFAKRYEKWIVKRF